MAVVTVCTMVEARCTLCGQWSRTHRDYMTCECGGQTQHLAEWVFAEVDGINEAAEDMVGF